MRTAIKKIKVYRFEELTEEKVLKIREMYQIGEYSTRKLAEIFKMGHTPMAYLISKKTWKHI